MEEPVALDQCPNRLGLRPKIFPFGAPTGNGLDGESLSFGPLLVKIRYLVGKQADCELVYPTDFNELVLCSSGLLFGVVSTIGAAAASSSVHQIVFGLFAGLMFLLAAFAGRKTRKVLRHGRMPLMRLDRDGLQSAAASLRWVDVEYVELRSYGDGNDMAIFALRRDVQPLAGNIGYDKLRGPRVKGPTLKLDPWPDGQDAPRLERWFPGPIVHN